MRNVRCGTKARRPSPVTGAAALTVVLFLVILVVSCRPAVPATAGPPALSLSPTAVAVSTAMPTTAAPPSATAVPPTPTPTHTPSPTSTPLPTGTPSPVPITEDEVLMAYQAWIDSWTIPGGDYEALTADGTLRFILSTACREAPAASSPEVLEISPGPTPTARLYDKITYHDCERGRVLAYLDGEFTMTKTPAGWQMTRWYMPGPTPRPVPTRDPNAPTAAPQPTAVPWDAYAFTRRVIAGINQVRASNGVGQVEYADWLQAFANDLARRYYNTGPMPGEEQLNAWKAEAAANGAYLGAMRHNYTVQNTFGCDGLPPTGEDPVESFRNYRLEATGAFRYMAVGVYGLHDGPCGPSVTVVILAIP